MMNLAFLLLNLAFQAPQPQYALLSECDSSAEVLAQISKDSPLDIRFAIGGSPTCYSVTATVGGKQIRGYVIAPGLDAIAAFERARAEYEREAWRPVVVIAPAPPAAATAQQAGAKEDPKAKPTKPAKKMEM
jgi:hypothetical protein